MATTTEIAARIAELKISTGTHEHAATWIPAAIHELETALGWAEHLERIEAANPGQESAERDNANRWIADHTDRGERIAREAGAHLPPADTTRPATLEYVTAAGRRAIRDLTRYTTDEMRQRVSVARRLDARGSSICRDVIVHDTDGRRLDLDAIPEPAADPAVYTITYTTPDIEADPNAARGFREVPARLVGHVSRLLAQRAASGAIWNIEARQLGRDVTFDIPAFRA